MAAAALLAVAASAAAAAPAAAPQKVQVVDYSMALCPCSAQFAQDFNASVLSTDLRHIIEFRQPFVANWCARPRPLSPAPCPSRLCCCAG